MIRYRECASKFLYNQSSESEHLRVFPAASVIHLLAKCDCASRFLPLFSLLFFYILYLFFFMFLEVWLFTHKSNRTS